MGEDETTAGSSGTRDIGEERAPSARSSKAGTGGGSSTATTSSAERLHGGGSVCPVAFCPICAAVSTVNRATPDVVEHLLLAGQQFLMAVKAVVDARAEDFHPAEADEPTMQRIDIG